ncbi:helix-turn-helix domain-containing protein [Streptomyces sp. NPDC005408]|uniref:helix-turn-helix domain-containing protein n=1 Tax=Streptomyces sp. NPDC005408 TaxID=3155341 RepID=UPI0033B152FD
MPTLGYLVDERSELQLRFSEPNAGPYADTKVAAMVVVSEEELLGGRCDFAQPPGTLLLLTLTSGIQGATAAAVDRTLTALAKYRAAGMVVTTPEHHVATYPRATHAIARNLRIPLLTTTADPAAWDTLNEGIQACRRQYAERQVENLAGLLHRLPTQLADDSAMDRITMWLADALEAQVLVSDPKRGVLAAAPKTAPAHLAHAVITQAAEPDRVQAEMEGAGVHTRLVALTPTRTDSAVLAVAADRPFDQADARLIQHAAKLLGLVDQAHRGYEGAARSAREARSVTYQLLMNGEPAKAQRVMEGLAPGLLAADEARIYVIDCGSADRREETAHRCEAVVGERALIVRCPTDDRHIVIVEPLHDTDPAGVGIAGEVQHLVLSSAGSHRMGGSSRRPIALVPTAYEEAIAALSFTDCRHDPIVLAASTINLVDLLDPLAARAWALRVLAPIRSLPAAQAKEMERTLRIALTQSHTAAGRALGVHRNTVAQRVSRAADLLALDLGQVQSKVVLGLALDITALAEEPGVPHEGGPPVGTLDELVGGPRVRVWAEALLDLLAADRRDLKRTLQAWLHHEARVEAAARDLSLSELTVRTHLKTIEQVTGRDLATLAGLRDIAIALSVCTGIPTLTYARLAAA